MVDATVSSTEYRYCSSSVRCLLRDGSIGATDLNGDGSRFLLCYSQLLVCGLRIYEHRLSHLTYST